MILHFAVIIILKLRSKIKTLVILSLSVISRVDDTDIGVLNLQAPPGVKKNLLRTYESWGPEYISRTGSIVRSQALFSLAWFHAVVQERRSYIPQVQQQFAFSIDIKQRLR